MSEKHLVGKGATVYCDKSMVNNNPGTAIPLTIIGQTLVSINGGKTAATDKDCTPANVCFGMCNTGSTPPPPCVANLTWSKCYEGAEVTEGGFKFLTEDSEATCMTFGGNVKIAFHGQTASPQPEELQDVNQVALSSVVSVDPVRKEYSMKSVQEEKKNEVLEGEWADSDGNKVDEVFFGDKIYFWIKKLNSTKEIDIDITIWDEGVPEQILYSECYIIENSSEKDLKIVDILIDDRWELKGEFRDKREAKLRFKGSTGTSELIKDIKISEFKVEDDFIIDGPGVGKKRKKVSPNEEKAKKNVNDTKNFTETVHAVILHRTDTDNIGSALNSASTDKGAHLYVELNGDIYNLIRLTRTAPHVGRIRPRGCPDVPSTKNIYEAEKAKSYPDRYPYNADSIGIEVVGKSIKKENKKDEFYYKPPTELEQIKSVARLVNFLVGHFSLDVEKDIYGHEIISSKSDGEGQTIHDTIKEYLL